MAGKSHSAIDVYKARRQGRDAPERPEPATRRIRNERPPRHRLVMLGLALLASVAGLAWRLVPAATEPVQLTYEIDLTQAADGALTITLLAEGDLPADLQLASAIAPGFTGGSSVLLGAPQAFELEADGRAGRRLAIAPRGDGWRLDADGSDRVGVHYRIDLSRAAHDEEDIRQHITTPVAGGLRAAGYELFLFPEYLAVGDITVMIHNPGGMPLLVPWPALVRGDDRAGDLAEALDRKPIQPAHLGLGQGFRPAPAAQIPPQRKPVPEALAAPVPANLFFHPRDLADLYNALIICGDIRTSTAQARDCVIQLATDQDWIFHDDAAMDLVRRIARTELGFFGSAPSPQITVLLSANRVTTESGFDVYGVHTGSSVLVLLSPETTYGMLEEQVSSVIAHEMFHGWLGEAIRQTDPGTLWFTEGITTWYSARMLIAAGLWTPEHAHEVLSDRLQRDWVDNRLAGTMSLAEAASEVMADPEQVRLAYAGGVAASMALDQWLAARSGLERPLDEVLRHLYEHYRDQDLSRAIIEEAVHAVTGVDCGDWLEAYVYGRSALPPLEQLI